MKKPVDNNISGKKSVEPAGKTEEVDGVEIWKNKYLRVLADYQNLEKRTRDQLIQTSKYAAERLIVRILAVIDTLEKAQEHLKDQGLELALKEFKSILSENDVMKIQTVGQVFDPHQMECIDVVEGEENIVVCEFLSGYKLDQKVIRIARVSVGKGIKS